MANIARVNVTSQWQNLEDVIEGFTPEENSQYELQNTGAKDLLIYEGATAPADIDGFVVQVYKTAKLTKKSGEYWFVRTKAEETTTANLGTL